MKRDLHIQLTSECFNMLKRLAQKDGRTLREVTERALGQYFKRRARKR